MYQMTMQSKQKWETIEIATDRFYIIKTSRMLKKTLTVLALHRFIKTEN